MLSLLHFLRDNGLVADVVIQDGLGTFTNLKRYPYSSVRNGHLFWVHHSGSGSAICALLQPHLRFWNRDVCYRFGTINHLGCQIINGECDWIPDPGWLRIRSLRTVHRSLSAVCPERSRRSPCPGDHTDVQYSRRVSFHLSLPTRNRFPQHRVLIFLDFSTFSNQITSVLFLFALKSRLQGNLHLPSSQVKTLLNDPKALEIIHDPSQLSEIINQYALSFQVAFRLAIVAAVLALGFVCCLRWKRQERNTGIPAMT